MKEEVRINIINVSFHTVDVCLHLFTTCVRTHCIAINISTMFGIRVRAHVGKHARTASALISLLLGHICQCVCTYNTMQRNAISILYHTDAHAHCIDIDFSFLSSIPTCVYIQYHAMQHNTIPYPTDARAHCMGIYLSMFCHICHQVCTYNTIQYHTMPYNTIQYSTTHTAHIQHIHSFIHTYIHTSCHTMHKWPFRPRPTEIPPFRT